MYCRYLLPDVKLQIKLTKSSPNFYLKSKIAETKTIYQFLDTYPLVRRVHPNPAILSGKTMALSKDVLALYNITRVDHK
jgi:hypothetical protein